MAKSKQHREIRLKLFERNPDCYWCGVLTVWIQPQLHAKYPDNMATLDHFRNRMDPLRCVVPEEPAYVLACHKCNIERGIIEHDRLKQLNPGYVRKKIIAPADREERFQYWRRVREIHGSLA